MKNRATNNSKQTVCTGENNKQVHGYVQKIKENLLPNGRSHQVAIDSDKLLQYQNIQTEPNVGKCQLLHARSNYFAVKKITRKNMVQCAQAWPHPQLRIGDSLIKKRSRTRFRKARRTCRFDGDLVVLYKEQLRVHSIPRWKILFLKSTNDDDNGNRARCESSSSSNDPSRTTGYDAGVDFWRMLRHFLGVQNQQDVLVRRIADCVHLVRDDLSSMMSGRSAATWPSNKAFWICGHFGFVVATRQDE